MNLTVTLNFPFARDSKQKNQKPKMIGLVGLKQASTHETRQSSQTGRTHYSLWRCRCGTENISFHSSARPVICERQITLKESAGRVEIPAEVDALIRLRRSHYLLEQLDRCRDCSKQVLLITYHKIPQLLQGFICSLPTRKEMIYHLQYLTRLRDVLH